MDSKLLKQKLEYHYRAFNKNDFPDDPIKFPHRFNTFEDIEIAALISSTFAFGSIKQINNSLEKLFKILEEKPFDFVLSYNYKKDRKIFQELKHRFISSNDIAVLFYALHKIYSVDETLKKFFSLYYLEEDKNLKEAISFFSEHMNELFNQVSKSSHGLKFMFPNPQNDSACKRMNLFLRWMIRRDNLDFGIWDDIPTSKLVIPVDTHIAAVAKKLKLTKQKLINWKMAEEITESLKKFDSKDPVKYDFSICHIDINKGNL